MFNWIRLGLIRTKGKGETMIYCVEDERNIRELLIYTLETTGFKARGFGNGAELMQGTERRNPGTDPAGYMLPEMMDIPF